MTKNSESDSPPLSDEKLVHLAGDESLELDRREASDADHLRTKVPESPQVCPKCNGLMEPGFILDMSHAARFVSSWARGAPHKSWIYNTAMPADSLPIGAFRCSSCGYLESYAREEFAVTGKLQFSLRSLLVMVTVTAVLLGIIAWLAMS